MWSAVIRAMPGGNVGIGDGTDTSSSDGLVRYRQIDLTVSVDGIRSSSPHAHRHVVASAEADQKNLQGFRSAGLYAAVTPSGAVSFRYDYRANVRRETLVIGRYDSSLSARKPRRPDEFGFGMAISLRKPGFYATKPTGQSNAEKVLHVRKSRKGSRRPRR